ncbi:MAG TPA: class II aldolase/adducin family protein [Ktedonobacterales bacterium]
MLLPELRAEVARYARKMAASGLVQATQGNLSARDPASGRIFITPSGADYDMLTADDIVVVDAEGTVVEGRWKPSLETPVHCYLLRQRADINCVMHTHSPYATAYGVVYQPIPMVLNESAACLGGPVPIAPYHESGSVEFAELVAEHLGQGTAVIWGNHGALAVGPTLPLTYSIAHALEDTARVYAIARSLGAPIRELPADEVARLHAWWKVHYGQHAVDEQEEIT